MTRLLFAVLIMINFFSSAAKAESQRVHDDIVFDLLFPAEMAIQESKACGKNDLSASVTQMFTSLVAAAGYDENYAERLLQQEFQRSYSNLTPTLCDESKVAEMVHSVQIWSKKTLADIAAEQ